MSKKQDTPQTPPTVIEETSCSGLFFTGTKSMDEIEYRTGPVVEPTANQIRVFVKYAGVNYLDILKKLGLYPSDNEVPFVSGVELSGIVSAVGANVKDFKVGDPVLAFQFSGCFASSVCMDAKYAFKITNKVKFEDAASIILNYVTAYHLLFDLGGLSENDVVLVPQASGGVGHAVIQLAKTVRNVAIIALCAGHKQEYMRSLGAKHTIDYRNQDYAVEVRKLYPEGVDLVLDSLNCEDSKKAFDLLRPFGKVIHYGIANFANDSEGTGAASKCHTINSLDIVGTNKIMGGYNLNTVVATDVQIVHKTVDILMKMLEKGQIKPKIDSIFPLSEGKQALLRMQNRQQVGKILLCPEAKEIKIFSDDDRTKTF